MIRQLLLRLERWLATRLGTRRRLLAYEEACYQGELRARWASILVPTVPAEWRTGLSWLRHWSVQNAWQGAWRDGALTMLNLILGCGPSLDDLVTTYNDPAASYDRPAPNYWRYQDTTPPEQVVELAHQEVREARKARDAATGALEVLREQSQKDRERIEEEYYERLGDIVKLAVDAAKIGKPIIQVITTEVSDLAREVEAAVVRQSSLGMDRPMVPADTIITICVGVLNTPPSTPSTSSTARSAPIGPDTGSTHVRPQPGRHSPT